MSHCCIIGGTGFIGSHVVDILLSQGKQLTVLGRNPQPTRPLPAEVRYFSGDYGDSNFLLKTLDGVDEIIDLAYGTVPKTSFDDPVQDILSNLPSVVKLFEVACDLSIKKLLIISSGGTVYGNALNLPITEDHPTNPISPYGITKLTLEKYSMMYRHFKNLPVVCVRPANAFGERQKPFAGQGFIATAIAHILKQQEVTLFGETGTIRDYIHVSDVANGIVAALDYGIPGSFYNIGSGVGRSNRDVLDALLPLAESSGLKLKIKILPPRHFDVPVNVLDCTKLRKETGWKAVVPFEVAIVKTWNWFCQEF